MAFAFARAMPAAGFPFDGESCFATQMNQGGSCRASARAFAGVGPCCGRRARRGFAVGDGPTRDFEVVDTPDSYIFYFDASDFERENLKVWVSEGSLYVKASRDNNIVLEKSWVLPKNVLQDGVSAKFDDDTKELTVSLLKLPEKEKAVFDVPIERGNAAAGMTSEPVPNNEPGPSEPGPSKQGLGTEPDDDMDADGTWIEVADTDVAHAKAKGKSPQNEAVLQEAEQQKQE